MLERRSLLGRSAPIALVTCLLAGVQCSAAEKGAVIHGRVADADNRPLTGAAVNITPGDITVVTDGDGLFGTRALMPGTYTVEILYLGSETLTQKVQIEEGKPANLQVKLQPALHGAQVVTVTGTRSRGEVEAMNQEKNAQDIVNVLPAEVIRSLPNANVADAVGRLPSVSLERDEGEGKYIQVRGLESRYTSVTVNGVRVPSAEAGVRQLKLDAFPSDLLGTIELHKTASADQEGDGIGGTVNLVTKAATDVPFYSLGAELGHNNQGGGRYSGQINGTFARRFGSDNELGVVFGATYDYNGRTINDIEPAPGMNTLPDGSLSPNFQGMDIREYKYYRHRWGMAGGLDYKISDTSLIYLKGFYSDFKDWGDKWVTTVTAGNFLTPTTTDATGSYKASTNNRTDHEGTYSYVAGGKHDLNTFLIDYNVSFSHSRQNEDNQLQAGYKGPKNVAFDVEPGDGYHPHFNALGGVNYLDPSLYSLSSWSVKFQDTNTDSTALAFNVTVPYDGGEFKTGLKYRSDDKISDYHNMTYAYKGPKVTMAQTLSTWTDSGYYGGNYPAGPYASLWAVNNLFIANPSQFVDDPASDHQDNDPNTWEVKEKVAAIYGKNTSFFSTSKLEYGLRVEHTSTDFNALQVNNDPSGNWLSSTPLTNSNSYTNVLPSINWRYEFDKQTLLRLAFGMSVCRPDYDWMVPSQQLNEASAGNINGSITVGNPNLKPTVATNYDVLFEHFLSPVGIVSAGIFYKNLKDPIYPGSNSIVVGGIYNGYTQTMPINGPQADVYGFETAWKQHLSFLPGYWAGLGTDINLTLTHSEATFDPSTGRSGTAALQRTAPVEANFGLTYDWKGFSGRVAATYNSAMLFTYNYADGAAGGLKGPNGDTYLYPHTQVDAQVSYSFLNGIKIVASALNLTNAVFGFYNGSPQYNLQREFYSQTYTVGLHYKW